MTRNTLNTLASLALVAAVSGLVYLGLGRAGRPAAQPSSAAANLAGYPAPATATLPPATATADPEGYLPPPVGLPWEPVDLASGPHAELLLPFQLALEDGDATWPSAWVADDRAGLLLAPLGGLDAEGGLGLLSSDAEALLEAYFAAGSSPRIQGYFERGACLDLILHRLHAPVDHPATPVSTSGFDYGQGTPEQIEAEAAALRFCPVAEGQWLWERWVYGDYDELLAWFNGSQPSPGLSYQLVRP